MNKVLITAAFIVTLVFTGCTTAQDGKPSSPISIDLVSDETRKMFIIYGLYKLTEEYPEIKPQFGMLVKTVNQAYIDHDNTRDRLMRIVAETANVLILAQVDPEIIQIVQDQVAASMHVDITEDDVQDMSKNLDFISPTGQ